MNVVLGTIGMISASSVVNSMHTLSNSIFSLLGKIRLTKHVYDKEIEETIMKTDLEKTLQLLNIIIKGIETTNEPVLLALTNLQNIITEIENELKDIYEKIQYNSSLHFFISWRSFDLRKNIKDLILKIEVLEKRRLYLFETMKLKLN